MPTIEVWNLEHKQIGSIELADEVFGQPRRDDLIWEVVKSQRARMRRGTASTKTRAEVSGTGAKPFRQKKTGRARQGTKRSPHHKGGGVAFGPKPREYNVQTNKKVRKAAMRSFLSSQTVESRLFVLKDFELDAIKTKALMGALEKFGVAKALLVDAKGNQKLSLSTRNLPRFAFRTIEGLNLVDMLRYENLLISEASVKQLEEVLKP